MANNNIDFMKDQWHKVVALQMIKNKETTFLITEEDITRLKGKHVAAKDTPAGLRITLINV
jgi:hypothetical protein